MTDINDLQVPDLFGITYPPGVVSGELITSAWGNAVLASLKSLPRGILGASIGTTGQTITTPADITETTVNYTVPTGENRNILILAQCQFNRGTAGGNIRLYLFAGATQLSAVEMYAPNGGNVTIGISRFITRTAGAHDVRLVGEDISSTGVVVSQRSVNVLDMGAV